ncbi:hypothetical protein [Methanoculleus sediminis]|uniref:hypothetical protein n=1 Tax=Methanoculleus sediminis TaxID=1550566 RepID=UPI000A8CB26E|nr:hypothetical protein [Methanoculleus sediminis]
MKYLTKEQDERLQQKKALSCPVQMLNFHSHVKNLPLLDLQGIQSGYVPWTAEGIYALTITVDFMNRKKYCSYILLLVAVSTILSAGCISGPNEAQNDTNLSIFPTVAPTTDVIFTNPPDTMYTQPKFTTGNVITDNPSNTCIGLVVLKPSPPQEAYVLREANRCMPNKSSWTWTGEPFSRSYAEIDNAYVVMDYITDTSTVIGPTRTIP